MKEKQIFSIYIRNSNTEIQINSCIHLQQLFVIMKYSKSFCCESNWSLSVLLVMVFLYFRFLPLHMSNAHCSLSISMFLLFALFLIKNKIYDFIDLCIEYWVRCLFQCPLCVTTDEKWFIKLEHIHQNFMYFL